MTPTITFYKNSFSYKKIEIANAVKEFAGTLEDFTHF